MGTPGFRNKNAMGGMAHEANRINVPLPRSFLFQVPNDPRVQSLLGF